jgi:hypothetical protein
MSHGQANINQITDADGKTATLDKAGRIVALDTRDEELKALLSNVMAELQLIKTILWDINK